MSLTIVYADRYRFDIGAHVFPMEKFARARDLLLEQQVVTPAAFFEPAAATWDELALVHDADYLRKTRLGEFSPSELALLELPWSVETVEGFRLMAGGTILAARLAVEEAVRLRLSAPESPAPLAVSAHLGGGFHHAFPAHGEGFCLFNDVAVAIRVLQRERLISRAAIVDCDVHQGNGTASTFEHDAAVFTFSLHQEHNYPTVKPPSSLDVGLPDGAGDHEYLLALDAAMPRVMASRPDLLVYVAGADPYLGDKLGGLNLTFEGLRGRDFLVLSAARAARVPVAIVLAGGYARQLDDTAAIHASTIAEAVRLAREQED